MNAKEVIERINQDTVAHLIFDWDVPDDYYPVIVWMDGDKYSMQCHDDPDPIIGDKEIILLNMASYNGDWKAVPSGAVRRNFDEIDETCPHCHSSHVWYCGHGERVVVDDSGNPRCDLVAKWYCDECCNTFDGDVIDTIWSDQS